MRIKKIFALLALTPLLSGCGGGGSSSSGSGNSVQQINAVDGAQSARLMSLVGRLVGGYVSGGSTGVITIAGAPGITPTTTVVTSGTITTTTANYGSGITSGGETISGTVVVAFNTANNSGTITFTNFTETTSTNIETINGTINFVITPGTGGASTEAVTNNLTVVDNGQTYRLVGTMTADTTLSQGLVEIPTASEALTASQGTLTETATDLTFDPTTHRADGGSLNSRYQAPNAPVSISVLVTFDSQTPTSDIVHVSVDGSPSIPVQVAASDL